MYPYALIDLHCDTLTDWKYTSTGNPDTLDDPKRVLSLTAMPEGVNWAQFYAVYVPDEEQGQAAVDYFEKNLANFERQMEKFSDRVAPCRTAADIEAAWAAGKTAAFLTIENGTPINGDLSRIKVLADQGVRCITLVWNGDYEIGSGHTTEKGLTEFGKAVVTEMEKQGIIRGYKCVIDWEKVDRAMVSAIIELKVTPKADLGFEEVAERIARYPEVESVSLMSGACDLTVVVRGRTLYSCTSSGSRPFSSASTLRLSMSPSALSPSAALLISSYESNSPNLSNMLLLPSAVFPSMSCTHGVHWLHLSHASWPVPQDLCIFPAHLLRLISSIPSAAMPGSIY